MKRHSDTSIIPKIIVILGTLSILGIILLILRVRPQAPARSKAPESPEKLFTQVIEAAKPQILKLWEQGDRFFPKSGTQCDDEIIHEKNIGRSYYQCNPHFWQCYWQGGVIKSPALEIDIFGQTFHVVSKASFESEPHYSISPRYYTPFKKTEPGFQLQYGYVVEVGIKELPGLSQHMILSDTCRDTYLPQRIYGQGQVQDKKEDGFIWDNFNRHIFLDKFYVTNRQVNEWLIALSDKAQIITDRKKWPHPAILSSKDQYDYCAYYGKRPLEAKLFDAATMTPTDLKDPRAHKVLRPDTPWQRDIGKTFLGMARINPDYQLTPLDCQLAQVKGCAEKFFSTDSATWMGFHFALGFHPESLLNFIDPSKNLKLSSKLLAPSSTSHQLGLISEWKGFQEESLPVAFRCYEEVSL